MVKNQSAKCMRLELCRFHPWVGKIPWRWKWQPTSVLLPGEFHGQRSLASYSSWGCKELDMTEVLILSLFTFKEIQVPSVDIICTTSPPGDCNVVNQILLTNYLALMSAYNLFYQLRGNQSLSYLER